MTDDAHLTPHISDRGFKYMPEIHGTYASTHGDYIRVYESSAADAPHVWLNVSSELADKIAGGGATLHLTTDDALKLADQLQFLVTHHYQGDVSSRSVTRESTSDVEVSASILRHFVAGDAIDYRTLKKEIGALLQSFNLDRAPAYDHADDRCRHGRYVMNCDDCDGGQV